MGSIEIATELTEFGEDGGDDGTGAAGETDENDVRRHQSNTARSIDRKLRARRNIRMLQRSGKRTDDARNVHSLIPNDDRWICSKEYHNNTKRNNDHSCKQQINPRTFCSVGVNAFHDTESFDARNHTLSRRKGR